MGTPLQVLIVEDSENDAKLMARELRRYGFEPTAERVETADSMTAALDRQKWDLILADYRLPHFSGPQALAIIKNRGLDVPFILVSGTVGEEKAVAAMKSGASDFVLKGSLLRLGAAVERELREAEGRRQRRRAEAALTLLADISKLLTDAPDYQEVLREAVQLAVPSLADWCILYSSGEHLIMDLVEVAHGEGVDDRALQSLAREYRPEYPPRPGDEHPIADALRSRRGVVTSELTEYQLTRIARDDAHRELLQELGLRSMIALPLLAHEHITGLWIFAATEPGRYTDADLALAQEVGHRLALVAENVRLSRAREEFVSTAVHEIKTPVAAIKMAVQLMQQMRPEQREARLADLLPRLDRQCNRLNRLVTDVLDVTRVELKQIGIMRRKTDVSALVDRVVQEIRRQSASHQIVIVRNDPTAIDIDADRIEQVLGNLIDNAIKYSRAGSEVEVAARRKGEELIVSVRDHGVGIPADRQARIFERFYRAHAGTPYDHAASLGVGLYLSREFISRHNGRMWFESEAGKGSTFYFSLPVSPPSPRTPEPRSRHSESESKR